MDFYIVLGAFILIIVAAWAFVLYNIVRIFKQWKKEDNK